jgi:hypothetical protein
MTQAQLNRAVAKATGECVSTIARFGFGLADPALVRFDPEPCDVERFQSDPEPKIIDWDALDARRGALAG